MPKGVYFASAIAAMLSALAVSNDAHRSGIVMPGMFPGMIDPRDAVSSFKKALNGKRRGRSVKAMARKAAHKRSVRRAKRHGQS